MIYLLAPAFNEGENLTYLAKSVQKTLKSGYQLIIVNDGSQDNTFEVAQKLSRKYSIIPLGYQTNRGPGYAFNFGIKHFLKISNNSDILVTLEADNSSDLSVLFKMKALLKKYDAIVASPFGKHGKFIGVSLPRQILSHGYQIFLSSIFRIKGANSYGNFFRGYNREILSRAQKLYGKDLITEHGFSCSAELLIKLNSIGAKITSIQSSIDWTRKKGKSKMKISKYIRRQFFFILKFWLLGPFYLKRYKS